MKNRPYYWKERKSWYIYYTNDQGKRAKKKIGDTKDEAYAEYRRMLLQGLAEVRDSTGDPLFEDVSILWLERMDKRLDQGEVSIKWLERVTGSITRWNKRFPGIKVSEVTPLKAQTWHSKASANYERTELSAISQCLAWALKNKIISSNPMADLKLPSMQRREVAVVDHSLQAMVLANAKHAKPLIQVCWLTGCRPGEMRNLQWSNVTDDLSEATLTIHKTARKTGKVRRIFFNDEARAILKSLPRTSKFVFLNSRRRQWTSNALVQAMDEISKKIGVKIVAGMFRHTFATNALEKGIPIATVTELMGHSSPAMIARVYGHLSEKKEHLRQAANQASSLPQPSSLSDQQPTGAKKGKGR